MTDPLEGVTDAHLQAALDGGGLRIPQPADVRRRPDIFTSTIAHARQIAANEKLAAELAELRAKYEPEPVDPVLLEARKMEADACGRNGFPKQKLRVLAGLLDDDGLVRCRAEGIRRGMEMQPAPFTLEESRELVEIIATKHGTNNRATRRTLLDALTTPHAELRAMLGGG